MSVRTPLTRSLVSSFSRASVKLSRRVLIKRWTVVRGDLVKVIRGDDKGKQGIVKRVCRKQNSVVVEGLNLKKRIMPPTETSTGYVKLVPGLIHRSNVALLDPIHSDKTTRVAEAYDVNGQRIRLARRSGAIIPKPDILKKEGTGSRQINPITDTPSSAVSTVTYTPPNYEQLLTWFKQRADAKQQAALDKQQLPRTKKEKRIVAMALLHPNHPHRFRTANRLPRLPPFEYKRADALIGKHTEMISAERSRGIPQHIGEAIKQ